ncbi:hypothetical protein DL96DRAFT_1613351 [Flagelloscypha sp. PMI_526]|nr:hypothetical protein DL96DRAFT_1613351 [Flagelloscypha sp. PMI_526]
MDISLPLDLAKLIIEFAASDDWSLRTSISLSLVSKEVQTWSDVYFFRDIVIEEDAIPLKTKTFMTEFSQENPPLRLHTARSHVRTFSTKQSDKEDTEDEEEVVFRFLALCSNLHSIALWHMSVPSGLLDLSIPSLRRLSFGAGKHDQVSFSMPLFNSITHLEIAGYNSSEWPALWSAGLRSIPSLTHLALDALPLSDCQSDLLKRLPASFSLVLVRNIETYESELMQGVDDPRIVVFTDSDDIGLPFLDIFSDGFHAWTGQQPEEETYWVQGEKLSAKQRQNIENLPLFLQMEPPLRS